MIGGFGFLSSDLHHPVNEINNRDTEVSSQVKSRCYRISGGKIQPISKEEMEIRLPKIDSSKINEFFGRSLRNEYPVEDFWSDFSCDSLSNLSTESGNNLNPLLEQSDEVKFPQEIPIQFHKQVRRLQIKPPESPKVYEKPNKQSRPSTQLRKRYEREKDIDQELKRVDAFYKRILDLKEKTEPHFPKIHPNGPIGIPLRPIHKPTLLPKTCPLRPLDPKKSVGFKNI